MNDNEIREVAHWLREYRIENGRWKYVSRISRPPNQEWIEFIAYRRNLHGIGSAYYFEILDGKPSAILVLNIDNYWEEP